MKKKIINGILLVAMLFATTSAFVRVHLFLVRTLILTTRRRRMLRLPNSRVIWLVCSLS